MNIAATQYTLDMNAYEVYISGCIEHPCDGCFSEELWDEKVGKHLNEEEYLKLKNNITTSIEMIDNIMIFGGEVLEKPKEEVIELLQFLNQFDKPIWLFTRFKLKEIDKDILALLDYVKVGMYDKTKITEKNTKYGIKLATSNQTIHKLR